MLRMLSMADAWPADARTARRAVCLVVSHAPARAAARTAVTSAGTAAAAAQVVCDTASRSARACRRKGADWRRQALLPDQVAVTIAGPAHASPCRTSRAGGLTQLTYVKRRGRRLHNASRGLCARSECVVERKGGPTHPQVPVNGLHAGFGVPMLAGPRMPQPAP